jgi:hypothetical protein
VPVRETAFPDEQQQPAPRSGLPGGGAAAKPAIGGEVTTDSPPASTPLDSKPASEATASVGRGVSGARSQCVQSLDLIAVALARGRNASDGSPVTVEGELRPRAQLPCSASAASASIASTRSTENAAAPSGTASATRPSGTAAMVAACVSCPIYRWATLRTGHDPSFSATGVSTLGPLPFVSSPNASALATETTAAPSEPGVPPASMGS